MGTTDLSRNPIADDLFLLSVKGLSILELFLPQGDPFITLFKVGGIVDGLAASLVLRFGRLHLFDLSRVL